MTQQNFTTALKNKLDAVANNATNVTNNNQLTNGANYITAGGSAASLGGVAATGYVLKTDNEALHGTDALAFSSGTLTLRKGDNTTETVSLPNTVYSVQDGQLSQNNFTNADHTKLDGIAAGANVAHYTSAIAVGDGGLTQKNFTTALNNKLVGIAAGATATAVPTYTSPIPVGDGGLTQKNFTTTLKNKLDGVATGATNTVTNATHTGEVTGSGALTIADNVVDAGNLKVTGNGTTSQFLRSDGDGTFTWVTPPNTQYSVGDGGLTQKNFTTALKNKLDGVTAGANVAYYTSAIAVGAGGLTQQNFTTTLKNKLDGVAASANNYAFPYTISQSASNNTVVRRHGSGYIFANYFNTTPNTVTSGVTQVCVETGNDGYIRHGTPAAIRTFINVADGANNFVHPNDGVDYGAANTGATIISDVAVNALGHVTGFTNRSLTLGNLGFTGATNANYITNNNQLTNGAGYVTGSGGTTAATANTLVKRDGSADINVRLVRSNYTNQSTISGAMAFRVNNGSDNYTRFCSDGAAIRTFIGAGTSNLAIGTTSTTAMAGNTTITSGVQSITAVSNSGISIVDGSTGTPEIGTTGNLNTLATASSIPSLSVDFLEAGTINANHIAADTIVASHIDADAITSEQLQISADSGNDRIQMDGTNNVIKIFSGGVLRVKIGNLA